MQRVRVEVAIKKGNKVLLMRLPKPTPKAVYMFPGGGVEEGDSLEETARKEALEELGVVVSNIVVLEGSIVTPYKSKKEGREKFTTSKTHFATADFVELDNSKYGADNDQSVFIEASLDTAQFLLIDDLSEQHGKRRIEIATMLLRECV